MHNRLKVHSVTAIFSAIHYLDENSHYMNNFLLGKIELKRANLISLLIFQHYHNKIYKLKMATVNMVRQWEVNVVGKWKMIVVVQWKVKEAYDLRLPLRPCVRLPARAQQQLYQPM